MTQQYSLSQALEVLETLPALARRWANKVSMFETGVDSSRTKMDEAELQLTKTVSSLITSLKELQTSQETPIPFSGADETPPVFGRRWKLADDGFGLQRDDQNGRYIDIEDALSVLHATLTEQRTAQRLQATDGNAETGGADAALAAEVQRLDSANKSLHEYTVQVNDECDKLQARIAELESQQVSEWFQEQVLKVQAERDALQAETLEVKGYWKAAAAKNRQLLTELADLQLRLDGQGKGDAQ